MKVFKTAKAWGLNHLRFHSWCPQKQRFGQPTKWAFICKLSCRCGRWWGKCTTVDFMYAEADRIIQEYGNHPSFCMWSMGNELQGYVDPGEFSQVPESKDKRHLYTTTSLPLN